MQTTTRGTFESTSPLLSSLEDLGALSAQYGIYKIKPFRDWIGSPWKDRVFSMRLCNAGEVLDIMSLCNEVPETARAYAAKVELVIRSVYAIDDRALVTPEELAEYNKLHHCALSLQEHLRGWVGNLEQIVVDRLDGIIRGLQGKQIRLLQGMAMCEACGVEVSASSLSPDTKLLKYALGEVLCGVCAEKEDLTKYDLQQLEVVSPPSSPDASSPASAESSFTSKHICGCGSEFSTLEEFVQHRESCPRGADIPA
jgi:hypothetical protein